MTTGIRLEHQQHRNPEINNKDHETRTGCTECTRRLQNLEHGLTLRSQPTEEQHFVRDHKKKRNKKLHLEMNLK